LDSKAISSARVVAIWIAFATAIGVPIIAAAVSPLIAWREPIYIMAGFAGVVALALLLVQPMLIGGYLPGISVHGRRRVHRVVGGALVAAIAVHVVGLWITSPPDVIDALLFVAPTPFSVWGVIAMWAVFAVAVLAAFRKRLRLRLRTWRTGHKVLAVVIVVGSVVHSVLIIGTMETVSKAILCGLVVIATIKVLVDTRMPAPPT